jgi:hypothetical protein
LIFQIDILLTKRKLCEENIINFVDLIDNFIKSKNIILREKVWNLFKHRLENENQEYLSFADVLTIFQENCKHVILIF